MSDAGIEARLWGAGEADEGASGAPLPAGKSADDALHLGLHRGGRRVGHMRTLRAWPDEGTFTVRALEVEPGHRRSGVGRAALKVAEDTAYWWRMRRVCLEVGADPDPAAAAFAAACGFAPVPGTTGLFEKAVQSRDAAPPVKGARITLEPVNRDNTRALCSLQLGPGQERFVAPNPISIAQAQFEPSAWLRAVCADGTPVGLVLMSIDEDSGQPYLWRFMIDVRWQRFGFGRAAIALALEQARTYPGARELLLSYVPAAGSPRAFYRSLGFRETGQWHEGELVMSRPLDLA